MFSLKCLLYPFCTRSSSLSLSGPCFSRVHGPGAGWGGGVPAACNSETAHGIEIKFDRVVENHKLINLV